MSVVKRTGAIIQPTFLPWRGFFSILKKCDDFVFLDHVQYDKRGWRNRNQIVCQGALYWITIPVLTKGKFEQTILETKIDYSQQWQKKILSTISHQYKKTKHFSDYFPWLEDRVLKQWDSLSEFDQVLTKDICGFLELKPSFYNASELKEYHPDKVKNLVDLCKKVGINHYISGPTTMEYMSQSTLFEENEITVEFIDYKLPSYDQFHPHYHASASILDSLFYLGKETKNYI